MPRRITLAIHSLHGGGAERITASMANYWAEQGDQVTLITLDAATRDRYSVAETVDRVGLDVMEHSSSLLSALRNNARRLWRLRRAIRASQPDHVVSLVVQMNVLTLMACAGLGLDVVVCERIDPRHHRIGPVWSCLRRLTYPFCRALTVQTEQVARYARRFVGKRRVYVVPNPVLEQRCELSDEELVAQGRDRYVVAAGRLVPQKGFDRLVEAFGKLADKHRLWKLRLLGDGPERERLEALIRRTNLEGRVELTGWISLPQAIFRRSDLYVLSSRYEGFPMVLLEAMACGLPVISFDCPSGPAEIVRHGIDGLLVPAGDVAGLAEAMDRLMSDEKERRRLAGRAREVLERFPLDGFFRRWDAILQGGP